MTKAEKGAKRYVAHTFRKIKKANDDDKVVGYIPMTPSPELMEMIRKALENG